MHQLGPFRAEQPQRARAFAAEMALAAAHLAVALAAADFGAVDAQRLAPGDEEGSRITHDVDGETAAPRGLAADRAIAELVGIGRVGGDRKPHGAAAARALERDRHGSAPVRMQPMNDLGCRTLRTTPGSGPDVSL